MWNRTTLLSAAPCHQCTTSPSICRNLRIRPRPVGVLLNPGRSAGTMNQVNSTNRNPRVALWRNIMNPLWRLIMLSAWWRLAPPTSPYMLVSTCQQGALWFWANHATTGSFVLRRSSASTDTSEVDIMPLFTQAPETRGSLFSVSSLLTLCCFPHVWYFTASQPIWKILSPLNYTAHSSADEPSFKTGCAEMGDCVPDWSGRPRREQVIPIRRMRSNIM